MTGFPFEPYQNLVRYLVVVRSLTRCNILNSPNINLSRAIPHVLAHHIPLVPNTYLIMLSNLFLDQPSHPWGRHQSVSRKKASLPQSQDNANTTNANDNVNAFGSISNVVMASATVASTHVINDPSSQSQIARTYLIPAPIHSLYPPPLPSFIASADVLIILI